MVKLVQQKAPDGVQGGLRTDKVAKLLADKAAEVQEMMTPRYDEDDELSTDAPVKSRWERLPSGTSIRIYWDSADEYYDCKILDWRVGHKEDGTITYTHRCQYSGGVIEHDLSSTEFEVVEADDDLDEFAASAHNDHEHTTEEESGEMSSGARSRMRQWLARQEEAEKDRVSTASEVHDDAKHGDKARGTMRRVHRAFKASNVLLSPLKRSTGTQRSRSIRPEPACESTRRLLCLASTRASRAMSSPHSSAFAPRVLAFLGSCKCQARSRSRSETVIASTWQTERAARQLPQPARAAHPQPGAGRECRGRSPAEARASRAEGQKLGASARLMRVETVSGCVTVSGL